MPTTRLSGRAFCKFKTAQNLDASQTLDEFGVDFIVQSDRDNATSIDGTLGC